VSDIDTAVVDSLKALDPNRPIREADIAVASQNVCLRPRRHRRSSHSRRTALEYRFLTMAVTPYLLIVTVAETHESEQPLCFVDAAHRSTVDLINDILDH
jgi:hypothetical protein